MADPVETQTPPANPPADPQTPPANPPEAVDEIAVAKREAAEARAEAAKARKEADEMKMQGLKSKEDYKTIADLEKKRADDAEAENKKIKKALIDDAKYSALRLEAQKQGINPISIPDLELLDFAEVVAESNNGRVAVSGVEAAIQALKLKRPNWFTAGLPNVNPSTPAGGQRPPNGQVTLADVKAAEVKYYASKSESDKKAYQDIIIKFKAQG